MNRVDEIRRRLAAALAPTVLDVRDDSDQHTGHVGARDGRGHFHVAIVSQAFVGHSLLQRQRMVFAAVGDLMQTDIHALGIEAKTEDEP